MIAVSETPETRSPSPSQWNAPALLLLIIVCGSVLRGWGLGDSSLWLDEALSWRLQSFTPAQFVARTAEPATCHPPLYFALLKAWASVFGESERGLRSLACVAGVLLIPLTYLWGAELVRWNAALDQSTHAGQIVGLLGAAFVAVSPLQVHLSQQVRGYALAALLAAITGWLVLVALRMTRDLWGWWLAWAISALLLCYTHHLGVLTVAAEVLFAIHVLWNRHQGDDSSTGPADSTTDHVPLKSAGVSAPFVALACVIVGYLPWLPHVLAQADVLGRSFHDDVSWDSMAAACYGAAFGTPTARPVGMLLGSTALLALAGLHAWTWRQGNQAGLFLLSWSLAPLLTLLGFSLISPRTIFLTRYLYLPQLGWLLMLALTTTGFDARALRHFGWCCLSGLLLATTTATIFDLARPREPGVRGAVNYIRQHAAVGEPILALSPQVFLTALPYIPTDTPCRLASTTLRRQSHSGSPMLFDSDLVSPGWPRDIGVGSFWLIRTDSYQNLAMEDLRQLLNIVSDGSTLVEETEWPQEQWWEKPIIVEHRWLRPKIHSASHHITIAPRHPADISGDR